MARKKKDETAKRDINENVMGLRAEVLEQNITDTLETNYMPYAMSVIVSRAIPEIDGFKPSHRKLLYTMYKMGLLTGARTKSARIVGQTMSLNPHGESAIYETLVRLSKGNGALLTPFVDSKGNFGKTFSRDMAYAASRYTEAKLSEICAELFSEIDKDSVDFTDNYDGTMREPVLLPTTFPNVLVSANTGIAVGMASQICGFNLAEVCKTTVAYIKDENHDILSTLPAPDFPTGGEIISDPKVMREIYDTGRGGIKVRAKWEYIKSENIIEVREIPYTTTVEAIMDKIAELIKSGKIKEISDVRDETDLGGLKIAIDLKRGTDADKLMQKLYRMTPLMDSYSCNFNVLINGAPRLLGVRDLLCEWTKWRVLSVKRRLSFDLGKMRDKLHLLHGLAAILLDIDRAIAVIRGTEREADVVPNLMAEFGIDKIQADYVAEIKLRNINREYLLKRTAETEDLEREIARLEGVLGSEAKVKGLIVKELERVAEKYAMPRKSTIIYSDELVETEPEDETEDYAVTVFVSKEGYLKKITPLSLRMGGEQKYKEGDGAYVRFETTNRAELLVFTDRVQAYKTKLSDFDDMKASMLGVYLPSHLEMESGEQVIAVILAGDYSKDIMFFYENGKAARVPLASYATKTNRKKLIGAYCDKSAVSDIIVLDGECDLVAYSTDGRTLLFNSSLVAVKQTRNTQGVNVMSLKGRHVLKAAELYEGSGIVNTARYRVRSLPGAGALLKEEDRGTQQLSLDGTT